MGTQTQSIDTVTDIPLDLPALDDSDIPEPVAQPVREPDIELPGKALQPQYEIYALAMASGQSLRKCTELAGFSWNWGWRVSRMASVRQRVSELLLEPEDKERVQLKISLIQIHHRLETEELPDWERKQLMDRVKVVMQHARLCGWLIDRKLTTRTSLDFGKMPRGEMAQMLGQYLQALDPDTAGRLKALAAGSTITVTATEAVTEATTEPVPSAVPTPGPDAVPDAVPPAALPLAPSGYRPARRR